VGVYLLPFWLVRYLPTTDGPSHVFNAWALGQLWSPHPAPIVKEFFEINRTPVPNWLGHAVLALLMRAMSPPVAEKVLVSGYVLLLGCGLWYLAGAVDRRRAWLALLGLPFIWSLLLQLGFYNFCISLGFFLLALGWWWRHRERPGLRFAAVLNLLLVLCYFAHMVSAVMALFALAVLWLASWRRERWRGHLVHLAILLPALALPLWFVVSRHGGAPYPSQVPWRQLLTELGLLQVLWPFAEEGGLTGRVLAPLFAAWIVFTLLRESVVWRQEGAGGGRGAWRPRLRWREEDGFLVLGLLAAVLYFVSPEGAANGALLKVRLELYPFLVLLPWLSARLGAWGRAVAVLALALLAGRPLVYALHCYAIGGRQVETYVRGLDAVPPGSVVLPLIFDQRGPPCLHVPPLNHATGYAAAERGLIDYDDYEAALDYFPLRFRADIGHGGTDVIESDPEHVPLRRLATRVDYVYCWRLPPRSGLAVRLARQTRLAGAGRDWRLYATD